MTEDRPLAGRSVVVTRTLEQSAALADRLEELGAEVIAFPVIATAPPRDWGPVDAAIEAVETYDWLVLTSTNGVDAFFERVLERDRDARALAGLRIAAVGSATADRIIDHFVMPDLVPADFRAEGLLESFAERGVGPGDRILLARAEHAREILPEQLREMGVEVDVVPVYRVVNSRPDGEDLDRLAAGVDVITFASGGTARSFVEVVTEGGLDPAGLLNSAVVASVGPVTTEAIRGLGYDADVEAEESTMPSLVEAIAGYFCDGGDAAACDVDVD
jgi:uroporphyrinogen III methyltransferase/synthase